MTISRRITLGFALMLLLTSLIGGVAAWQMRSAAGGANFLAAAVAPQADTTAALSDASNRTQLAVRTFGLTGDRQQLEIAEKALADVQKALDECRALSVSQPSLTALAAGIKSADAALAEYKSGFEATKANLAELTKIRGELDTSAAEFVASITTYITGQDKRLAAEIAQGIPAAQLEERRLKSQLANDIIDAGNSIRIANFKSQALRSSEWVEKVMPQFDLIEQKRKQLLAITRLEQDQRELEDVRVSAAKYHEGITAVIRNAAAARQITTQRAKAAEDFDKIVNAVFERSIKRTTEYAVTSSGELSRATWLVLAGLATAVVAGLVASFLIITRLNRVLRETSSTLTQGAVQIASASAQVSATSQGLAQGASEQAASLEEISASIEELASTTKHNAENAGSAKSAADEARAAAEHGSSEMIKMQEAMAGIRQSSTDISKIIKTIDEIAFQTNILALNAAVEAARAGDAGAGFAVVADEVRNLAQRCAVAARETTDKISDAANRSEVGANLSTSVSASLQEIVTKSREVDRLVAEVANASREQSAGISQVSTAVGQMDSVTQNNAASAEESASAAEELSAQSSELRHASLALAALVGLSGDTQESTIEKPSPITTPKAAKHVDTPLKRSASPAAKSAPAKVNGTNGHAKGSTNGHSSDHAELSFR